MRTHTAAALLITSSLPGLVLAADDSCTDWAANVISAQGRVELRRSGEDAWLDVESGETVCLGDSLRTGLFARAVLQLPNDTTVDVDEDATLTFVPPEDENRSWLDLIKGLIYVISRDPRALKVTTPYLNAGLEGTEFLISVDGDAFGLTVHEGEVLLESESASVLVASNETINARSGTFGQPVPDTRDRADVLWAQHYPQILEGPLPDPAMQAAGSSADAAFFAARAQARIAVGRIEAAREDIAQALALIPDYPSALAVDAMIALTEGDSDLAEAQLRRALANDPDSPPALIAESFLLVGDDQLRAALSAVERAAAADPGGAIARARLATVQLATGEPKAAVESANLALAIDPGVAEAHSTLGFAALTNGDLTAATRHFENAVERDSASPLPRVGLAIALMRAGDSIDGRYQLEAAVALDANDSLVRSYMGKAYFDEMRNTVADSQLDIARLLDPEDPTASLYAALLRQAQNQPVGALALLTEASEAAGNRLAFRSTLHLDEDLVTPSSGVGRVYRSLGFEELALLAGSYAVVTDPLDHAGHRLLGDVYSVIPRQQIARVNEVYQARMLQPINVLPSAPQLALANIFIADSVGPAALAHAESRSSFAANGLDFQTSAIAASHGTRGESAVVAGLADRLSFNLGQYHYESGGFRENNDFEHDAMSAIIQARPSAATSMQAELRATRIDKGDSKLLFDQTFYDPVFRQKEESDSAQFGVSHQLSPWSKIVGSLTLERASVLSDSGETFSSRFALDSGTMDVQLLREFRRWNLVSGIKVVRWNAEESTTIATPIPVPPFIFEQSDFASSRTRHVTSYLYSNHRLAEALIFTVGASVDSLDGRLLKRSQTSPKLGLVWHPRPNTYLRAAAFEAMLGTVISKQLTQPSLEPMQVAGFGQYLFGSEGEITRNYGIGLDHGFTANLRAGLEHTERRLEIPFFTVMPPSPEPVLSFAHARESGDNLRVYWTPTLKLALSTGWTREEYDFHDNVSPFGFRQLRMNRVPVEVALFVRDAVSLRFAATNIRQRGEFLADTPLPTFDSERSRFWVLDASVDYRLPNRRGSIEIGVKNLLDKRFRFQDSDPENPQVFPERFFLVRFSLSI